LTTIKNHGAGPLFTRLARAGRLDDLKFLAEYVKARSGVANDNVELTDDMGVDSVIDVRPTENEIMRACMNPDANGNVGLRYDSRGRLIAWRQTDAKGDPVLDDSGEERWFPPSERYRQPRGARRVPQKDMSKQSAAHAAALLSLSVSGTLPPACVPDSRYPSAGAIYSRIHAAHTAMLQHGVFSAARRLLVSLKVDGGHTLAQAARANPRASAKRGRTVVAYGAEFISGRTDSGGTATEGSFVGAPDAMERALVAAMDARTVPVSEVLEMALAGSTAREIAVAQGYGGTKQAERKAVTDVDAEIAKLRRAA
jgi:hypothetical protein